ncbi:TPA: hypothetical protein ACN4AN_004965, partial [Vibrio parahaemolyticus]
MVLESQKVSGCLVAYFVSGNLLSNQLKDWWETSPNKQFNSDSQRLVLSLRVEFSVYGAAFKFSVCAAHT